MMKHLHITNLFTGLLTSFALIILVLLIQSCSTDVGGNEDKSKPLVALTSLNDAEEVIGDFTITWETGETNKSTVDIHLSTDSGVTYNNSDTVALDVPDTGSFMWQTNDIPTLNDCRNCRIRITPTDVVGNVGEPAESAQDFIINNIPQVLGVAFYSDKNLFSDPLDDGPGDGDTLRIPFDKNIELLTAIASDIFIFPVLNDNIGPFATVAKGTEQNELIITFNDLVGSNFHLHINNIFDPDKLNRTRPSGLNILNNLAEGILFAKDTGRTAQPATNGIDIAPAFTDSGQALGDSFTESVALGDVDGDGDLDFIAGNSIGGNRVWLNQGGVQAGVEGEFTDSLQTLGNNNTRSIALGDVDGDGDLDLITGNNFGQANRVWLNQGGVQAGVEGEFTDSLQTLGNNDTRSIALGDIDGDGDLDLITGNDGQANHVWLNNINNIPGQEGVFTDSVQAGLAAVTSDTRSIALGDVDGDGDLDLITGNDTGQANRVWLNNINNIPGQEGVFTDSEQALGNSFTQSIALGDVDGDGDLDLITGNSLGTGANLVWFNNDPTNPGAGKFTDSGQRLGNSGTASISLGDVDADGDLDLIIGGAFSAANQVWLNNSSNTLGQGGVFTDTGQALGSGFTESIALGDVDADGDLDLIAGNLGENRVWLNSAGFAGREIYLDSGQALANNATFSVALGDIDGDGDIDLFTGNLGEDRVWLNNSNNTAGQEGVFTDSGQAALALASSDITTAAEFGDVDGDGDLDLITGNFGQENRVWLNNMNNIPGEEGVFTDSVQPGLAAVSNDTESVAPGDVDGDGDLDLITGNFGQVNRVWLNNINNIPGQEGVFTDSIQPGLALVSSNTGSVALGDVDGDGDLDLITGNSGFGEINRVWLNNINNITGQEGVFTDSVQPGLASGSSNNTRSVALGDVDGDGDLDLITGNDGPANRVWLNNINNIPGQEGVFTDSVQTGLAAVSSDTKSIALGDVDGDGDLDLITGNGTGQANRVWLNNMNNTPGQEGVFTDYGQLLDSANTSAVALGDVDGDSDLDLIEGIFNEANRVWLNDF